MEHVKARCTTIIAVVVALHLEGCATGPAPGDLGRRGPPMGAAVTISNMTTLPIRIYLRRSSIEVALGTVQGLSSRTFQVDDRFVTDANALQLEARDRRGVVLRSDTFSFGSKRAASWRVALRSMPVDVR
jgi:hypothetical protein